MPDTKEALLDRLDRAAETWHELRQTAERVGVETPGIGGGWTFKQVAGHLNGWRTRSVARLEAAATGTEPAPAPWPAHLSSNTDEGVDEINRWIDAWYAARSAAEIFAETDEQLVRMRSAVERIPEDDLLAPGRYSWLGSHALAEVVVGSSEHLHDEHEADIRAWLRQHGA